MRKTQTVAIDIFATCNAECVHCCLSCGPKSPESLSDETLDRIVGDLLLQEEVGTIGLTGGELLLRKERALRIIKRVNSSGKKCTLVSNGFWGVTPSAAEAMFGELETAGLDSMTISYDDFHFPYIPVTRIANVLRASKKSRIKVLFNMAVTTTQDSSYILSQLGDSTYCIPVTRFPVLPAGRAAHISDAEFLRETINENNIRCPGFELLYHYDGKVYPCCSPAIFGTALSIGTCNEGYQTLANRVERNALLAIVRNEGLGWFKQAIENRFPDGSMSQVTHIVSACELCLLVFRDPDIIRALKPEVHDYFTSRV